jgi:hypothetical protein
MRSIANDSCGSIGKASGNLCFEDTDQDWNSFRGRFINAESKNKKLLMTNKIREILDFLPRN